MGSALEPAGRDASHLAQLFWGLTIGAFVIWLAVVALALYGGYAAHKQHGPSTVRRLIIGGGVIFPVIVLTGLLTFSLSMLPGLLAPAPEGSLKIHVTGYQWWWRVEYLRDDGTRVELANELHLPVGAPVEFELESRDVIHSFWIAPLGGKVDMIPGRRTRLRLEPTRVGTYRGVCAEYCGASHALMAFYVVVEEQEAFERWLAHQAQPASAQGGEPFFSNGCGACHAVRGTRADGKVGPDLTHVGSRLSIGAGTLAADAASLRRWIQNPKHLKPSALMPAFGMLPETELDGLASWLESLR